MVIEVERRMPLIAAREAVDGHGCAPEVSGGVVIGEFDVCGLVGEIVGIALMPDYAERVRPEIVAQRDRTIGFDAGIAVANVVAGASVVGRAGLAKQRRQQRFRWQSQRWQRRY